VIKIIKATGCLMLMIPLLVQSPQPEVVALRVKRLVPSIAAAERGSLISPVLCIIADRIYNPLPPPILIFQRRISRDQLVNWTLSASVAGCRPSGFLLSELFTR
jgi:hypothetical protein